MQLLLDQMTETEKQLVLKVGQDVAVEWAQDRNMGTAVIFPLQKPEWNKNVPAHQELLREYKELVAMAMEK